MSSTFPSSGAVLRTLSIIALSNCSGVGAVQTRWDSNGNKILGGFLNLKLQGKTI